MFADDNNTREEENRAAEEISVENPAENAVSELAESDNAAEPDGAAEDAGGSRKKGGMLKDIFEWAESVAGAIIAIIFIFTFVVRVTSVDGTSMVPTLHDKERLLVTNFFYQPKHNDIVVLYAENIYDDEKGKMGKVIVKRVIGVPGDVIHIDEDAGTVYRNGEALVIEEKGELIYEDGHLINNVTNSRHELGENVTVPENCIFVLGDNRGVSLDSRFTSVGMVDMHFLIGRAFFRFLPFKEVGSIK